MRLRKALGVVALGLVITGPLQAAEQSAEEKAAALCDAMRAKERVELEGQFKEAPAGVIPDGQSIGCVVGNAQAIDGGTAATLNRYWLGKKFDADAGMLTNTIIGENEAFDADVWVGEAVDGGEYIIIQYSGLLARVRDEIRQVDPNYYLGKMYYRDRDDQHQFILYFSLYV